MARLVDGSVPYAFDIRARQLAEAGEPITKLADEVEVLASPPTVATILDEAPLAVPATVRIRARYAELRAIVRATKTTDPMSVRLALLRAGDVLETARTSADLARARAGDRLLLLDLHERIDEALAGKMPGVARMVFDDLRGVSEMLRRVSEREELRAHDASRLRVAERVLRERPDAAPRVAMALFATRGLDDALDDAMDAVLAAPEDGRTFEYLREAVSRALLLMRL